MFITDPVAIKKAFADEARGMSNEELSNMSRLFGGYQPVSASARRSASDQPIASSRLDKALSIDPHNETTKKKIEELQE